MLPDLTDANGVAALWVSSDGPLGHGWNFILHVDGTGEYMRNFAGASWQGWDALPTKTTTTLNDSTHAYESVRELAIDVADVVRWSPWTCYLADGTWYYRGDARDVWAEGTSHSDQTNRDTHDPENPANFDLPE